MAKREIDFPAKVWSYIDQCRASGLYGETIEDTMLSLMRTGGFEQAMKIGILDLDRTMHRKRTK